MIRFMFYHVVKIIRLRYLADEPHALEYRPVWMVSISILLANPFFIPRKIVFSNLIIPEGVKTPVSCKPKKACMYLLILPGITKYPVYRLHFQKIFSIGRKKALHSP